MLLLIVSCNSVFAGGEENARVIIKDFEFIPQHITVKVGQKLVWENREKRQYHSVWFEQQGEEESDYLFPEDTYEFSFQSTGTYPYRCGPHPKMIGSVTVIE